VRSNEPLRDIREAIREHEHVWPRSEPPEPDPADEPEPVAVAVPAVEEIESSDAEGGPPVS
jgi:hypothetical protein